MLVEDKKLRQAFSLFATGVAIASIGKGDQEIDSGLTINSFSSVSLKPPLLLFSIDNESSCLEKFKSCNNYSINILSKSQKNLAIEFAKSTKDKKPEDNFLLTKNNNPIFKNSIAFFECNHHKIIEAGDHHIFIGQVTDFSKLSDEDGLFYFKSNFI